MKKNTKKVIKLKVNFYSTYINKYHFRTVINGLLIAYSTYNVLF